jgi:hypothetical protein
MEELNAVLYALNMSLMAGIAIFLILYFGGHR